MSACIKFYNYFRNIPLKELRRGANFISLPLSVQANRCLQVQRILEYAGGRSIYTSNNYWTNISFNLTDIGEGIREVVLKEWYVKIGDHVAQFDNICEVQSDKASATITSRYDGIITKLHYDVDDVAHVGKPLVDIETLKETQDTEKRIEEKFKCSKADKKEEINGIPYKDLTRYKNTLCIPSVRLLAKEHDVDLSKIKGTGKNGRILKEDVLHYLNPIKYESNLSANTSVSHCQKNDQTEKISGFKKVMVNTMTNSLKIPHFLYCDEIRVTKLNQVRIAVNKDIPITDTKLTVLSFFIKAASNALHKYPILNSILDESCENIIYKKAHNIGIAMDTQMGLAVPVIKHVEKLNIKEIAKEIGRLKQSGKSGTFNPSDLSDGTFTISNIGTIGGTYTAPIILSPQVAIIAIAAAQVLPRFDKNNILIPEEIISLSGSADHRIIDGATMARFINFIKKQVEDPYMMFFYYIVYTINIMILLSINTIRYLY